MRNTKARWNKKDCLYKIGELKRKNKAFGWGRQTPIQKINPHLASEALRKQFAVKILQRFSRRTHLLGHNTVFALPRHCVDF